jgi:hypothetical protein
MKVQIRPPVIKSLLSPSLKPTPLIFPENLGNNISNILLISNDFNDYQQFFDSANENTLPIIYSMFSSKTELLTLLEKKFTNIQRIGFAFRSNSGNVNMFLDRKPFFSDKENCPYGENMDWLINVIKTFKVKNIDFLSCNSLNYPSWINYFNKLTQVTNVIVGASNDKTGNIKHSGDWVMETTNEDIELIYFTKQIEYYKYLLDSVIVNNISYTLSTEEPWTASIDSGNNFYSWDIANNPISELIIPSEITYESIIYTVTNFAIYSFYGRTDITSITIPNTISEISVGVFGNCTNLQNITIPESVTSILNSDVDFGFQGCINITSFDVNLNNQYYSNDENGVLYNKDKTIIVKYPSGRNTSSYSIQESIVSINNYAFDNAKLQEVYFLGTNFPSISSISFYLCGVSDPSTFILTNPIAYITSGTIISQDLTNFGFSDVITSIANSNICFPSKTPIKTDQGSINIDEINPDIHTIRGKKIVAITQTISPDEHLICFDKNSLGNNIPSQKTFISMNHEIFYNGKMIKAKNFVNDFEDVKRVKYTGEVLYNVLMEEHEKMIVNNLICETLHPKNTVAQVYRLLPKLTIKEQINLIKQVNEVSKNNKIYASKKR